MTSAKARINKSTDNKFAGNEGVITSVAQCPNAVPNTRQSCDVEKLKISDSTSGRSTEISRSMTKDLVPKEAPARLLTSLYRYDAVLELLSAYEKYTGDSENAKKKNVKLSLQTSSLGQCPNNKHLMLKVTPLDAKDNEDRREWLNATPDPVSIYGRSHFTDQGIAKWIAPFWQFGEKDVKQLVVSVESCGVRDQGKPNKSLTCLVRVYRSDVYSLSFKVPPFKQIKRERKSTWDASGTVTRESSSKTILYGDTVSEESHKTQNNTFTGTNYKTDKYGGMDANGHYLSQEYGSGFKDASKTTNITDAFHMEHEAKRTERGGATALYRTGETIKYKSDNKGKEEFVFDAEPQEIKPTFSLKRNGNEMDFTKAVNDIINLQNRLTNAWNEIKNWVPKVGWWLEMDLSILSGEISGSWGNRYPKNANDGDRYKLVEQYFDLDFNLKIIDYSLKLGAGINFSTPDILDWFGDNKLLEVILKAEGKIFGDVTVKEKISSLMEKGAVQVSGSSDVDIYVHGQVTAMGYKYNAKGGIKGGISFEGALIADFDTVPQIKGEFNFVETVVYAFFKEGKRRSRTWEKVVFKKKEIWKGSIPNC